MDLKIKNKIALVTGSTAGIGYAIAKALAAEGAMVFVNGRTNERVNQAVDNLVKETGNKNIKGLVADFAYVKQVNEFIGQLTEVDILVNNVGIFEPKEFSSIPDEDWLKFYEVNVLSGVRLSRAYFDKMLEKLGPDYLYLERIGFADTRRNDPLRHDKNGTDRSSPRPGGIDQRLKCNGKCSIARTDIF